MQNRCLSPLCRLSAGPTHALTSRWLRINTQGPVGPVQRRGRFAVSEVTAPGSAAGSSESIATTGLRQASEPSLATTGPQVVVCTLFAPSDQLSVLAVSAQQCTCTLSGAEPIIAFGAVFLQESAACFRNRYGIQFSTRRTLTQHSLLPLSCPPTVEPDAQLHCAAGGRPARSAAPAARSVPAGGACERSAAATAAAGGSVVVGRVAYYGPRGTGAASAHAALTHAGLVAPEPPRHAIADCSQGAGRAGMMGKPVRWECNL